MSTAHAGSHNRVSVALMRTKNSLVDVVMSTKFVSTEAAREDQKWWVIDAAGVPVGRVATAAATLIRGKHKTTFTPNVDGGDFVVVVNAGQVALTGAKKSTKLYRHHTGYIGTVKTISGGDLLEKNPERAIELAVEGMLPAGVLGHRLNGKLKVYRGSEHPHQAQSPAVYTITKK
jgi:large subunit ribosomal protein L13